MLTLTIKLKKSNVCGKVYQFFRSDTSKVEHVRDVEKRFVVRTVLCDSAVGCRFFNPQMKSLEAL